jgi:hypothetical protein
VTYVITEPCIDVKDKSCTTANAAFFTEGEEPLGSPGGFAKIGPLVRDVAFVADYRLPDS